ncbi:TPA: hypothetical protein ACS8CD_003139 [Providencia alcalifaciens]
MNQRDWIDWVVNGASILSSLGIFATIYVYLKQDSKQIKDRENEINAYKVIYNHEFNENTKLINNKVNELINSFTLHYNINFEESVASITEKINNMNNEGKSIEIAFPKLNGYSQNFSTAKIAETNNEMSIQISRESAKINLILSDISELKHLMTLKNSNNFRKTTLIFNIRENNEELKLLIESNKFITLH